MVVALSADALPQHTERAKRAGFHSYQTKPINVREFLAAMNSAFFDAA